MELQRNQGIKVAIIPVTLSSAAAVRVGCGADVEEQGAVRGGFNGGDGGTTALGAGGAATVA